MWVLWWQKCLSYQQCLGLVCVGLDTIVFHETWNMPDLSEFWGKDNWLLERLSCSMEWWCRQDECWSSTGHRHLLWGPAQPRRDTRALQSWRRRKLKNSLVQCFLAIMATFLYYEGKNISCLQYKSLQKRSYTHLATLTPRDPPSPAFCLFWMHKTNLGWECAAKYPHHPSKISASLYYKVNKTTEQRNTQSYSSWMKTVNQSAMSSQVANKTKQRKRRGLAIPSDRLHLPSYESHIHRPSYAQERHKNSKRQQRKLIDKNREGAKQEMTKRDKTD